LKAKHLLCFIVTTPIAFNVNCKGEYKIKSIVESKIKEIVIVLLTLLLVVSVLINCASYFNSTEIKTFTSKCYDNGGEARVEIHNSITNDYSFECK
jgi:hypothetical protein